MPFDLAKVAGFFLSLPNAAIIAVLLSALLLWTPFRLAARVMTTGTCIALAIVAFSPLASALLRPLEDRFPQPKVDSAPTGLIVLGGTVDEFVTAGRGSVALGVGAERLTEAVVLSRRFPAARLVFSGGSGRGRPAAITEADVARQFWQEMGVADDRMVFENKSRDTWENATFTKALLQPKEDERWLLVTSAAHMPRAVGIFRRIGFPITPYPVDYRTTGTAMDYAGLRDAAGSFGGLALASHEWVGLVAYRLAGKTDALFPGP